MTAIEHYNNALAPLYDKATASELSWNSALMCQHVLKPHAQNIKTLLDIGVGTGQSIDSWYQQDVQITGLDISSTMLKLAENKYPDATLHKCDLNENPWPLGNNRYNVVLASGVIEFLDSVENTLAQAVKHLSSDGILCFTYEEYIEDSLLQSFRSAPLGQGMFNPIPESHSFEVKRYTPDDIENLSNKLGLTTLEHHAFIAYFKVLPDKNTKVPVFYRVVVAKAA